MSRAAESEPSGVGGALWLFVLGLVFLGFFWIYGIDDAWFAQNNHNRRFVEGEGFLASLAEYRKTWPPLYPSVLYGWSSLGFSPDALNAALGVLSIILVARLARRLLPEVSCVWPAAAWAIFGPHALIARQLVAEELLCVLSLAGVDIALSYRESRGLRHIVALALVGAAVALTRYFGALWLLVPAGLFVLATPGAASRRIGHAALLTMLSVGLCAPWFSHVEARTGHPTGIDRFDRSETSRMAGELHLITPRANLEAMAETLFIDGFSTHAYAKARRDTYVLRKADVAVILGIIGCGIAWGWTSRGRRKPGRDREPDEKRGRSALWIALLCGWFFALVLFLWSIGNNDPINTRFLFPVYPFLLLLGFGGFSAVKRTQTRPAVRAWQAAFALLLAAHLMRHGVQALDVLASH